MLPPLASTACVFLTGQGDAAGAQQRTH
jgi:hypothetical protein